MAVLDALVAIENGRAADRVLKAAFDRRKWLPPARSRIARLTLGVCRHRAQLDWWLEQAGCRSAPLARLAAALVLIEGLDKGQLRKHLPHLPTPETHAAQFLMDHTLDHPDQPAAVRSNLPSWLMPHLKARFGDRLLAEATALCGEAGLDMRANAIKGGRDAAMAALAEDGIIALPTPYSPVGLRVEGRPAIARSRAWREGLVEVQDEASQLAALILGAKPGERVLDFCAGAGGKTLAIAAAMANKGRLIATDSDERRLTEAVTRLRRADVHNVTRHVIGAEGDKWLSRQKGAFDRVLVDAPCTGTGTFRRNPDAKWRSSAEELAHLTALQAKLLDRAAALVKPGGRLVYATCSILAAEDEDQIDAFLARHAGFRIVPLADAWAAVGSEVPEPGAGPHLLLTPARHETDGFFAAVLERLP
ncbi:RsmB/NOP family class I SAM-dependent RNA methyltransferase [Zavarzinia compransoris]|uniref:rRNA cytosine-C5-methylase n=1 Tax=Zavarzinia compransoris TaxID=1264899 RepID=A0A317E200_9PROT|nr:RsmB/NOP family class I SAM-dependent RNA methyltransferase [Zavarzinia compransoris]PWR20632.1 rRNA cytosine-C5-methylase [Zavarzinia compransoris]TDP44551.1 16S rRNA (cytosine967-C5)-methyltransferase [Zavarzinia compransoris]